MIKINILPDELRIKTQAYALPKDTMVKVSFFAVSFLVGVHLILLLVTIFKFFVVSGYESKLPGLEPKIVYLESIKKELNVLESKTKVIDELARKNTPWSVCLYKLSKNLPSGIWFEQLILKDELFTVTGKVVSRSDNDLSVLNVYLNRINQDPRFRSVKLSDIKKTVFRNQEVTTFSIRGMLQ